MVISKRTLLSLFFFLFSGRLLGQESRYMVFFKDKNGTPYSVAQPLQFLSQKSVNRRTKQGITILPQDLPVNPGYVAEVKATGAKMKYATKWFNGILMEATTDQKDLVKALPNVFSIEYVAPGKTGTGGRVRSPAKSAIALTESSTKNQYTITGLDAMRIDGLTGANITIAVFDSGFPAVNSNLAFNHLIQDGRILDAYNFSYGNTNVFIGDDHGARVLSVMAANLPSDFTGGVVDASYLLYSTEFDATEFRVEEYNWAFAAERADSAGADIISSSLGYNTFDDITMDYTIGDLDGETTVISKAAMFASERGMVVVSAAGNLGNDSSWGLVAAPADVKNVIAVGSIDAQYNRSPSSSLGPTADNRVKPDAMAMGTSVAHVAPGGAISYGSGTSFSCPLITSLVAGVWQQWPDLKAIDMVNLIRQAGSKFFHPDNAFGYGVPTYQAIKHIMDYESQHVGITLYPVPIIKHLSIEANPADGSRVSVVIQNSMGQVWHNVSYELSWGSIPFTMDLEELPSGVYWVSITKLNERKIFRVIKK